MSGHFIFLIHELDPKQGYSGQSFFCQIPNFDFKKGETQLNFQDGRLSNESSGETYSIPYAVFDDEGKKTFILTTPQEMKVGVYSIKVIFISNLGNTYEFKSFNEKLKIESRPETKVSITNFAPNVIKVSQAKSTNIRVTGQHLNLTENYQFKKLTGEGPTFLKTITASITEIKVNLRIVPSQQIKAGYYQLMTKDTETGHSIVASQFFVIQDD